MGRSHSRHRAPRPRSSSDPRPRDRGARDLLQDDLQRRRERRSRSRERRGVGSELAVRGAKGPREKLGRTAGFDAAVPITDSVAVSHRLAQINAERALIQAPFTENPEVEAFLAQHTLEPHAIARLRSLPADQAKMVMDVSLDRARNKTAVILSRVKYLSTGCMNPAGISQPSREERSGGGGGGQGSGLIALLPRPNAPPQPGLAKMDEMAQRVNQDLVKAEGEKLVGGDGARGSAVKDGAMEEEDMAIEDLAGPPGAGASAGAASSGASSTGRHGGGMPIPRPFASNPFHRKPSPPRANDAERREHAPPAVDDQLSRPILGDHARPPGAPPG
ncbi:unnamed protein product, partial [Prorocentrum cordatum]